MKRLRASDGFTLVELVMTLSIASLLLVGILVARGQLSTDVQFTGSLDAAKNNLRSIQNTAVHAVADTLQSSSGQSKNTIFGKLIEFVPNSNTVKVYTLIGANNGGQSASQLTNLTACREPDSSLGDQVDYTGGSAQSVVFNRSLKQLFVVPPGATLSATGVGTALCDGTTPVYDSPTSPSPKNPCASGVLTYGSSPVGTCVGAITSAPEVIASSNGTSVDSTSGPSPVLNTSSGAVTIDVGVSAPNARVDVTITDTTTGALVYSSAANSAGVVGSKGQYHASLGPISLANGTYKLSTVWTNNGTAASSTDITIKVKPSISCSAGGYQCGLLGQYYRGMYQDNGGTRTPESIYVDTQIGNSLGGGASSYSDFLPTLRARTNQPYAQYASVQWTGEIYLDEPQSLCTYSDDLGDFTITDPVSGTAISSTRGQNWQNCMDNVGDAASPRWWKISINYANIWSGGEGRAWIRFMQQLNSTGSQTEVPGSILRTPAGAALRGPSQSIQGLDAIYYTGDFFNGDSIDLKSSERVDGVGTASTPATFPDWSLYVRQKTGAWAPSASFGAYWIGYYYEATGSSRQFCSDAASASALYWVDSQSWLFYDSGPHDSGPNGTGSIVCSNVVWGPPGSHVFALVNQERSSGIGLAIKLLESRDTGSGMSPLAEVPLNMFATYPYYIVDAGELPNTYRQVVGLLKRAGPAQTVHAASRVTAGTIASRIAQWLVPQASANVVCDTNILNAYNYGGTCTSADADYSGNLDLPVQLRNDTTRTGTIHFDHAANTITWVLP